MGYHAPMANDGMRFSRAALGAGYFVAAWVAVLILRYTIGLEDGPKGLGISDLSYLAVILVFGIFGIWQFLRRDVERRAGGSAINGLLGFAFLAFLFSWFFALVANMEYAQRLELGTRAINLSVDSAVEQQIAVLRFFPFFLASIWGLIVEGRKDWWKFPLAIATTWVHAMAFPNFFVKEGLGFLGLVAMIPIFVLLDKSKRLSEWWVLGFFWALISTMLRNYWLGTYSLVTLQGVALVFGFRYALFFLLTFPVYRFLRDRQAVSWLAPLFFSAAWVVFEYWAGHGWVGYPWTLAAHSLYLSPWAIQFASVAGVWGVSFLVYGLNAGLAEAIVRKSWKPAAVAAGAFVLVTLGSALSIQPENEEMRPVASYSEEMRGRTAVPQLTTDRRALLARDSAGSSAVRINLVQQNEDPRKQDAEAELSTLIRMSEAARVYRPDLVVWSETAFPPSIRHWSENPGETPVGRYFTRLVDRLLDYQKSMGAWLITGNDDFAEVRNDDGSISRTDYNAAILFDPQGTRVDTYHKMVLVPLTESFPYEEFFPEWFYAVFPGVLQTFEGLARTLTELDVNLWGRGYRNVVFEINGFRFSTPICFEDAFPFHVRESVLGGARAIINISNDYWALDEVQAQQHLAAGLFRAVENRVPVARSTASGVTGLIDPFGRIVSRIPNYQTGFVVVDVVPAADDAAPTLYTLLGDWFPILLAVLCAGAGAVVLGFRIRDSRRRPDEE